MNYTHEQLQDLLKQKQAEIEELQGRVDFLNGQNSEQQEQNDALAAHVEHLDGLRRNVIEAIADDRLDDLDISFYRADLQPSSPATSLARHDAHQRAQGITDAATRWPPGSATRSRLLEMAEDARLKAEGDA